MKPWLLIGLKTSALSLRSQRNTINLTWGLAAEKLREMDFRFSRDGDS